MLNETFSVIFKHRDKEEDNEIFGADDDEYEEQFLENPLDSFEKMTYESGKDYYIESRLFDRKNKPIKTQLYTDQFATLQNGRCLRITINEALQEVKMMELKLLFNATAKEKLVIPKQADLFIASKNSWQGLVLNKWPFFQVEQIPIGNVQL